MKVGQVFLFPAELALETLTPCQSLHCDGKRDHRRYRLYASTIEEREENSQKQSQEGAEGAAEDQICFPPHFEEEQDLP